MASGKVIEKKLSMDEWLRASEELVNRAERMIENPPEDMITSNFLDGEQCIDVDAAVNIFKNATADPAYGLYKLLVSRSTQWRDDVRTDTAAIGKADDDFNWIFFPFPKSVFDPRVEGLYVDPEIFKKAASRDAELVEMMVDAGLYERVVYAPLQYGPAIVSGVDTLFNDENADMDPQIADALSQLTAQLEFVSAEDAM